MDPDSSIHWGSYPALLVAGALATGILIASTGWLVSPWTWSGGAGLSVLLWIMATWDERRRLVSLANLMRLSGAIVLGISVGALRLVVFDAPTDRSLHRQAQHVIANGDTTTITGHVAGAPTRANGSTRFKFSVATWRSENDVRPARGMVQVTLRSSPWDDAPAPFPDVFEGDRLSLHGQLEPPPEPRNPADFDYGAYLSRRGIHSTLYVSQAADVRIQTRANAPLQRLVNQSRAWIRMLTERHVPTDTSQAVLQALLLGDKSHVNDRQREAFARTGLMHLLAVSGLHVLLVGMVLYTLLRPILHRLRLSWRAIEILRAGLTIGVLVLYMLLTGSPPSVVRAVIMAALLIGGIVLQRSAHTLNTLGVAAIVLLMLRPTALFDAGFQLSLSAVTGIVVLNPRIEEASRAILPERWMTMAPVEWLVSMITVSLAATLGTAPVLLHHFGFVALGGLVLNVVAIPLTAIGLTAGLLMVLANPVAPVAASSFGIAADAAIRLLAETALWGETWMGAGLELTNPSGWTLLALITGVLVVAQFPRPRHRWRLVTITGLAICISFFVRLLSGDATPKLTVTFLDVGQGDAVLVTTPEQRHMLIDGGPVTPYSDAGASVIQPHLEHLGIESLDVVVATHPDSDHLGGLPTLFESVSIGQFIHSGRRASSDLFERSRALLHSKSIPSRAVVTGDRLALGSDVIVEVLSPPPQSISGAWSENDASVVLAMTFGKTQILLPGDIEATAEAWLVETFAEELDANLVKVAHHGSSTSSSSALVQSVTGGSVSEIIAVIPVGRHNKFGMPVPEILTRWHESGTRVLRTDLHGSVSVHSDGRSLSAQTIR
ncbi:DNA internalization-related competence protein ComEC/Rec2 [Longibacter salinarum]|uniref:DNA internalization-related competence protein ComEC/Rec2 n=1 Tax=Longibacter salinarum TaxID=1850348 RepID=UPI0015CF7F1F|nr:DNA internalization-related competence protein ComEC/Rec2 [Longibacter salinarum]